MDGSSLAPIVIPIVALVLLFGWLALVYYANSHPPHRDSPAAGRSVPGGHPGHELPSPRSSPDESLREASRPAPAESTRVSAGQDRR